RFSFHEGSVLDYDRVAALIEPGTVVYHLASAVGVRLIVEQTLKSAETMLLGTETVLRATEKKHGKILLASTSEVYGKTDKIPFREDDDVVLGPTSKNRWSYAACKMVDEFLGLAYNRERNVPVAIFRLFNTVGPRQSGQYGMVVPRFVGQALDGQDITVYGDGQQSRSFCDARDVVVGIAGLGRGLETLDAKILGQVFNLGSQNRITIQELAELAIHAVQLRMGMCRSSIVRRTYEEAYGPDFEDIRHRMPDLTKARSVLGWNPRIGLEETIDAIISEKTGVPSAFRRSSEELVRGFALPAALVRTAG
ncbi:MAG: GDP-mannose 4,6-dehydratase, partial [Deltaproteobacteria bacterium]|nr:GDP-mannose 4,6-dehydratase [Deltaproteobacteria bacterium]